MNIAEIEENLKTNRVMNRQEICNIAMSVDDTFRDTLLRNLIENLLSSGAITRIGRNCYIKMSKKENIKKVYSGMYSGRAEELMKVMTEGFSLLRFQVWELRWLNEFLNHLVGENIIFLDVDKEGCEFVFEELRDKYDGELLLRPDADQIYRYGKDGTIVIGRLVTEAPQGAGKGSVTVERIMVELEANKILRSLISTGEIPQVIRDMYDKYQINDSKLLRYARRRNKEDAMLEILGDRIRKK